MMLKVVLFITENMMDTNKPRIITQFIIVYIYIFNMNTSDVYSLVLRDGL